jgi:hypothetical protein
VDEIGYQGERVFVRHCPLVQVAIVLNWPKFAILFLYEEKATGVRRLGLANLLQTQILFNEGMLCLLFLWRQGIDPAIYGRGRVLFQVDSVIPFPWSGEAFRGFLLEYATITIVTVLSGTVALSERVIVLLLRKT